MGQEIDRIEFTASDFAEFGRRLKAETAALRDRFEEIDDAGDACSIGFELECCLVDPGTFAPAMCNQAFLQQLASPLASAELARHNVEFNTDPVPATGTVLSALHRHLTDLMSDARRAAEAVGTRLVLCGILPTLEASMLTLAAISPLNRYFALNEQVVLAHAGTPFRLDIKGREHLVLDQRSVMLEAAATSLQIHLRVPHGRIRDAYNASILVSAPVVGLCANSPMLFGHDLWEETRIPLFEQSVGLGGKAGAARGPLHRVSFGSGYAQRSVMECFEENLAHFPVLLPILDDSGAPFAHLTLQNGTIWRWNRPIVGLDADGSPHLRIEHRSLPAGPSVIDSIANTAFFVGLVRHYMDRPVETLEFARARSNFHEAARFGSEARIDWLDGERHPLGRLGLQQLVGEAAVGLEALGVARPDIECYLGIIEARLKQRQNGAQWQRRFLEGHPRAFAPMTQAMLAHQLEDVPVHTWEV